MKRAFLFFLGLLWMAFACGFGFLLVQYLGQGSGPQFFFIPVLGRLVLAPASNTSESVLLGLIHFVGFTTAILICFAIGAGLCARALVPSEREDKNSNEQNETLLS